MNIRCAGWIALVWMAGCSGPATEPLDDPSPSLATPVDPSSPIAAAADDSLPIEPLPDAVDRCEAVIERCGGWVGCATVRETERSRYFVGVGSDSGRNFYDQSYPSDRTSRVVLQPEYEAGVLCARRAMRSPIAPFDCVMDEGACVQRPPS